MIPALLLLLAAQAKPANSAVVIDGSGRAVLAASPPSASVPGVVRFNALDPKAILRAAVPLAKELKVRGSVQLVIESGLSDDPLIMISGSASVTAERLDHSLTLRLDDAASATVSHCRFRKLRIVANDSSTVRIDGSAEDLTIEGSGSANIVGDRLNAFQVTVTLVGTGMVRLGDVNRLNADLSSTGGVIAKTWIALSEKHSGVGRVKRF